MLLIVGLGNPTEEYAKTFHNLGFMTVDKLSEKLDKKIKKAECNALTATFSRKGETIVLAKPMTYMNESGQAVKGLMQKYGISSDEVIVIFDDFAIPRFATRARAEGSGGSHNGMKNVIALLGTEAVKRIRIGMGNNSPGDKKDYVLSNISADDLASYDGVFSAVAEALIEYMDKGDFNLVMRSLNVHSSGEKEVAK